MARRRAPDVLVLFMLGACGDGPVPETSFGVGPGCNATCTLGDGSRWTAPAYTEAQISALEALTLLEPPGPLDEDPYLAPPPDRSGVCAVHVEGPAYRLRSHPDAGAARAAGGRVTHAGRCGACSSLRDLAVYLRRPDLTAPVRACAAMGLLRGDAAVQTCLEELGFSAPCAQIWAFNARHTRRACLEVCIENFDAPNTDADGRLNPCLACDEAESGPVFKAVAGRTRRGSGVPSAICRPCDGVTPVDHRL